MMYIEDFNNLEDHDRMVLCYTLSIIYPELKSDEEVKEKIGQLIDKYGGSMYSAVLDTVLNELLKKKDGK